MNKKNNDIIHIQSTSNSDQKQEHQEFREDDDTSSFKTIALQWMSAIEPSIKQSTYVKYINTLNSYLLPEFSSRLIEEITRQDIIKLSEKLMSSGGKKGNGLSSKTVSDIISILRRIILYAKEEKNLSVSDIHGITIKHYRKPLKILSISDQKKLDCYLRQNPIPCNIGILLCLYSGLRIGEICALKWGDLCDKEHIIHVSKTMQRLKGCSKSGKNTGILISPPKSMCSVRNIPLPESIIAILEQNRKSDDAYILSGSKDIIVEPRTLQNRFKKILHKIGIEQVNFHVLRHTFATRCVELNFDIKSLSEILGHSSVNITLDRYVHPSMELKKRNMNLLSDLFQV